MSSDPIENRKSKIENGYRYRHLPWLTWALLLAITVYFVVAYVKRPNAVERQGLGSVDRAVSVIRDHYYKDVDEEQLYRAAVQGIIKDLDDRFTLYLRPADFENTKEETEGEFGGIGVTVRPEKEWTVIVSVQPEGPAAEAGVQAGDVILQVDDAACKGLGLEEVIRLVRGPVGKSVRLALRRNGRDDPLVVKLKRKKIEFPFAEWKMLEPRIGYFKLLQFDKDCDVKFEQGVKELLAQTMSVLILDLRGNAGGLLPNCVNICDMFIKKGVIVSIQGRNKEETKVFEATKKQVVPDAVAVLVLVNSHSASAAEILTGFLKDYGRATIIGTRTFGKGAVNRIYPLPDESAVMLTVAHYQTPNGTQIGADGIAPDKLVGEVPEWDGGKTMPAKEWVELYKKAEQGQYDFALKMARDILKNRGLADSDEKK